MAHQSLYRRYRPQRFSEVRGQDHLVGALRRAVDEERVGHAYLFSGPRGTGKTTTARILAKAVNCPEVADGEPCGICESCVAIADGTSFDLHELDAASKGGVEEMRALIETIALGTPGHFKVYILDEAHMLSPAASAALLKTLEEPPDHVVFVLATTHPQKVLPTIRSRTQHFDLQLLGADELASLVHDVSGDAGLDLTEDQIEYSIRAGAGSARDTLSALDQVVAAGGIPDRGDGSASVVAAIRTSDPGAALTAVQEAVAAGREPRALGEDLVATLRDAFLVTVAVDVHHLTPESTDTARELGAELGARSITRSLELLGGALIEMRQAADPRIPLEVALLRMTAPEGDDSLDALADRVAKLERSVRHDGPPSTGPTGTGPTSTGPTSTGPTSAGKETAEGAPTPAVSASRPAATAAAEGGPGAGGGPASGARAVLEEVTGSNAKPALGGIRASDSPSPKRSPADAPAPASTAEQTSTSSQSAAVDPASGGDPPSRDAVTLAWGDQILPGLAQKIRSRWSPGRFLDSVDGVLVFALPNAVTCERCAEQQGEVEQAITAHFGARTSLRLVVDENSTPPRDALDPADLVREAGEKAESTIEEVGPVDELEDAGDEVASGVSRLSEAFPGAELVEVDEEP